MSMGKDKDANVEVALHGVKEAARRVAQLVCLPELFAWQYFPTTRNSDESPEMIPGKTSRALSSSARENGVVLD